MDNLKTGLGLVLTLQALLAVGAWHINPLEYTGQRIFGAIMAVEFVLTATVLYVYSAGRGDYDQEWVVCGLAFAVIIGLLTYFTVR